jgi:hypothetical protein
VIDYNIMRIWNENISTQEIFITSHCAGSRENDSVVISYSMKQRVLKRGRIFESMAMEGALTDMAPPCISAEFLMKFISESLRR